MNAHCVMCGSEYQKIGNSKTCSSDCSKGLATAMTRITIPIPKQQVDRLVEQAEKSGVPLAEIARRALDEHMDRNDRRGRSGTAVTPRSIRTIPPKS
jgi:hypothetical protein